MQKRIFSLSIILLVLFQTSWAQSYVVSGIEKTDKEGMQYEVLGKMGKHYWVYKKNGSVSTIAQYNDQMQLVKQNDLTFLPAQVKQIEFIKRADQLFAFYQFQNNKTVYAALATLNGDGQLKAEPIILDTAQNIRPGSNVKIFNLIESDDHQKIMLFSVNTSNPASIKIKTNSYNGNFEEIADATITINSNNKKSTLSDFALDNKGNLFCLRNATQNNAAPAVSLIYLSEGGREVMESSVLNSQFLLDDIRLKVDNNNNRVLLNSFYAIAKKGNIEGLFTYIWDANTKREVLSSANRFTDANRALMTTKRNLKTALDTYYIDKVNPQSNGDFVVMAESAETYSNRSAFSRWDYFWGGPFYNPFIFNYWYRPFGFYPWARLGWMGFPGMDWGWGGFGWGGFGWGGWGGWGWGGLGWSGFWNPFASFGYPTVTYNAKQIALMSFDQKGNLNWVKTIDKSQSDLNVDQFIGYGSFENNNGVNIIYYQKQKGQRQFVMNTLSADGIVSKSESIILQEKRFDWIPKALKQVGEKECIIPYQYNNKIGFAKIQLK
ncbi:MAG: hypothetical protein RL377_760 [Bacteroidota bacterium]